MVCIKTNEERNYFYEKLDDIISTQDSCYFHSVSDEEKYECLISANFVRAGENDELKNNAVIILVII